MAKRARPSINPSPKPSARAKPAAAPAAAGTSVGLTPDPASGPGCPWPAGENPHTPETDPYRLENAPGARARGGFARVGVMAAFGVLAAVLVALSLAVPGCSQPATTNAATVQALQDAAQATREAAQAIQAAAPAPAPADPNGPPVPPPSPAQAAITKAGETLANAGAVISNAAAQAAQAAATQPDNPGAAIGAAVTAAAPLAGPYAPIVAVLGSLTTLAVGWFSRGRVWTAQDRRDAQAELGLVDVRAVASPGIAGPLPVLAAPAPAPVSASRVGPQTSQGGATP